MESLVETNIKSRRVRVHGKLTIVSSTPVGPGRSCPLSSLDHAMANHTVRMVYYYGRATRAEKPDGPVLEFDPLRMSLCELLCLYPTLTGRLARDSEGNWQLTFNDAGVRVLRANVGTTLDEWLRTADGDEEMDLTAWDHLPDDPHVWPPFRIQRQDDLYIQYNDSYEYSLIN
ncbi:hypothetical protein V2J09_001107 [Rumex salicifolius]